jgi:signal transduction histidine kinase
MDTVRRLYWRLGTADAINWQNIVTIALLHTSGSIITAGVNFDGRFFEFLAVRFAGLAVFFAVLGLGKIALLRFAQHRPKPLITLTCFLAAITAGTYAFDLLLILTGFTDQSFLARRLTLTVVGLFAVLVLVSAVVTTAREFATQNDALRGYLHELDATRRDTQSRIAQHRQELVDHIRSLINDKLSALPLSPTHQAATMRTLIDDVIRPVSHAIAVASPATPPHTPIPGGQHIPWRQVVTEVVRGNPFSRLVLSLTLGVVAGGFLIVSFQFAGLLATLSVMVFAALTDQVWRVVWPKIPPVLPTWVLVVVFSLSATPTIGGSIWLIANITGFDLSETTRLAAWVIVVLVTWWSSALSITVFRLLRETTVALDEAIAELRREVAELGGSLRHQQKMISRALHGPVQAAVTSSLHRLSNSPHLATDSDFAETLREHIQRSVEQLQSPEPSTTSLAQVLADTQEVWEGVTDITAEVSAETLAMIDERPSASYAVSELIREAVSNAVKHGKAHHITVSLTADRHNRTAHLCVTNNGLSPASDSPPGLGSTLFDELCMEWAIQAAPEGVVVTAQIPLIDSPT